MTKRRMMLVEFLMCELLARSKEMAIINVRKYGIQRRVSCRVGGFGRSGDSVVGVVVCSPHACV